MVGISILVDLKYLGFSSTDQTREPAHAVAPHGIDEDPQSCIADGLEVDQFFDMGNIGRSRVKILHHTALDRLLDGHSLHFSFAVRDILFDLGQSFRIDSPAIFIPHFETVICVRIMRGSDIYRSRCFFLHNRI